MNLTDTFVHRILNVPYRLNAEISHKAGKKTVVLLHGIGNSLKTWHGIEDRLGPDYRIVKLDLLGFGKSPKPDWIKYDAVTQARAVRRTIAELCPGRRVIIVGHSLGSLVAIEVAKRYRLKTQSLILCSPPFYQPEGQAEFAAAPEKLLRYLYNTVINRSDRAVSLASLARRFKLIPEEFGLSSDNQAAYIATLKTMILNQTSLRDTSRLSLPISIVYGQFDPLIIPKYYQKLVRAKSNITKHKLLSSHEIDQRYLAKITEIIVEDRV
ncbi:hypothetical protein B7Y94_02395 [Candidatus Saccharibacteria bacterium 32-49-12]|nr:MAG: hypothetical protein B7Y94_02395 [Candidatus Saccharibacteria bacterium 32-49-12]